MNWEEKREYDINGKEEVGDGEEEEERKLHTLPE